MATMAQMYTTADAAEREADYREQQADPREREIDAQRARNFREHAEQLLATCGVVKYTLLAAREDAQP